MQFVVHIPRMGVILMGFWMEVQVSTIRSSVICENKYKTGFMALSKILMISCEILLKIHLNSIMIIYLLGSFRGIVDVYGYAL